MNWSASTLARHGLDGDGFEPPAPVPGEQKIEGNRRGADRVSASRAQGARLDHGRGHSLCRRHHQCVGQIAISLARSGEDRGETGWIVRPSGSRGTLGLVGAFHFMDVAIDHQNASPPERPPAASCVLPIAAKTSRAELVRRMQAAGGREAVPRELFVARRPPHYNHFFSQRLRQAYGWARPARFVAQLALLPAAMLVGRRRPGWLWAAAACGIAAAEIGRRKGNGGTMFPSSSASRAPAWPAERSVTSWMALSTRLLPGGVRHRAPRLKNAATPQGILDQNAPKRRYAGGIAPAEGRIDGQ